MNTRELMIGLAIVFGIAGAVLLGEPDLVFTSGTILKHQAPIQFAGAAIALVSGICFVIGLASKAK